MQDQIILYNGPNSPFGRKTKVTALVQEIKLEEKIIEVDSTFKDKMKNIKSFYEKNGLNNINSSKIATNIIIENLNNKNDRN